MKLLITLASAIFFVFLSDYYLKSGGTICDMQGHTEGNEKIWQSPKHHIDEYPDSSVMYIYGKRGYDYECTICGKWFEGEKKDTTERFVSVNQKGFNL